MPESHKLIQTTYLYFLWISYQIKEYTTCLPQQLFVAMIWYFTFEKSLTSTETTKEDMRLTLTQKNSIQSIYTVQKTQIPEEFK